MSRAAGELGGVRTSPNIWNYPATYELENLAFDQSGAIEATLAELLPPGASLLLDIGCGTGYHLPRFVALGGHVVGVEPFVPLALSAKARIDSMELSGELPPGRAEVLVGSAESLPVADSCVDLVVARWAYFFGPGCEPGLAEVERVLRPGAVAAFLDNDATTSTFGGWFADANAAYDPLAVQRFWSRRGFTRHRLTLAWDFTFREDFEAVVRIEFAPDAAARILDGYAGTSVDYAVNLWWRRF